MKKEYAKFINYGMRLLNTKTGERYRVVDTEATKQDRSAQGELTDFLCVCEKDYGRYETLTAWIRNGVKPDNAHQYNVELISYRELLPYADVTSVDEVRFITSDYKPLFKVRNFDYVILDNGTVPQQVVYYDAYHFAFMSGNGYASNVYHICQFAEICEHNGRTVKPYTGPADGHTPEKLVASMKRLHKQYVHTDNLTDIDCVKKSYVQGTYIVERGCVPRLLWFIKEGISHLCPAKTDRDANDAMSLMQMRECRVYEIDLWACTIKLIRDRNKYVHDLNI